MLQVNEVIVRQYTVEGRTFTTKEAAEAYIASQAATAEYRKFAETLQEGKSPKAVQAVVNVLVKYHQWLADQSAEAKLVPSEAEKAEDGEVVTA